METSGNSLTLLGIFLLGLGLNLTPCVYPMMSVTVSLFGTQKASSKFSSFFKALAYVLGIATMYSSLGVVTAFTGGFFGALLQNKGVLMGVGVIFIALSLSMFGVYTLNAPSALMNKLAGRKAVGVIGFYISGLFVGIFAAPCIGPPILALLAYVGTKGSPGYAFLVFFVMSMGLGLPYLLLGTFSSLLTKLPRSGGWLLWVERLFGVVLMTLGFFYLILAVKPSLLNWLIPSALILGGIYLGFLERSVKYGPKFFRFKTFAGIVAVLVGMSLPLFAPKQAVAWEVFSKDKLEQAKADKKPVLLDFYADWCIPCHELDQYTYSDPQVIKELEGFVRLKVDMTNADDEATQNTADDFGLVGVPTIIFLDSEGKEVQGTRVTGFIPAKEFLELVRMARNPGASGEKAA